MGCGKRKGKNLLLLIWFDRYALPQADRTIDRYCSWYVRGDFIDLLSLHHFAMHFCLAIKASFMLYI